MRFEERNAKLCANGTFRCYDKLLACVMGLSLIFVFHSSSFAQSQPQPKPPKQHRPPRPKKPPQIKPDELTLRYKPQSGTLLYDVHTDIGQHINISRSDTGGSLSSSAELSSDAQLAFHTVSIDYRKSIWSFEQFFTNFRIRGRELSGDSLILRENMAVNRITSLTYDFLGGELNKKIIDTLKLLNAEAQTNAYFFEPPRMLIPLPEHVVTYGDTWTNHTSDSVQVRDTVNIGITTGGYIYDVTRTFRFAALRDTMGQFLAVIVVTDSGTFKGSQTNSITRVTQTASGPISGTDTTLLDMASGRVVRRTLNMRIPALVKVFATGERKAATVPFTDIIDVRSVVALDESNATKLPGGEK
jgi:hypothetical protein